MHCRLKQSPGIKIKYKHNKEPPQRRKFGNLKKSEKQQAPTSGRKKKSNRRAKDERLEELEIAVEQMSLSDTQDLWSIITTEWKNEVQWRILIERLCSRLEERREEGVEEIEEMGDLFIHTALRIAGIVASGLNIDRVLEEQKAYDDVRISTRIFTDNSKQNKKIMQNFEEFWRCLVISLAEKDEDNETDLLLRVVWFVIVQSNSTCREQREFFTYLALLSQRELLKVIRAQNYFSAQSLSFAPNKAAQKFMKTVDSEERSGADEEVKKEPKERIKKLVEDCSKEVINLRCNDIINLVRVTVANHMQHIISENGDLCICRNFMHIISVWLYDKFPKIRIQAVKILSTLLEDTQIREKTKKIFTANKNRILELLEDEVPEVSIATIEFFNQFAECGQLTQRTKEIIGRLIFHKDMRIKEEVSKFICEKYLENILKFSDCIREEKTNYEESEQKSRHTLLEITKFLSKIIPTLPSGYNAWERLDKTVHYLSSETSSLYDLKSMCKLLLRGEGEQSTESKLPDDQILIVLQLLKVTFAKIKGLQIRVGDIDSAVTAGKGRGAVNNEERKFVNHINKSRDHIILRYGLRILRTNRTRGENLRPFLYILEMLNFSDIVRAPLESKELEKIYEEGLKIYFLTTDIQVMKSLGDFMCSVLAAGTKSNKSFEEQTKHEVDNIFSRVKGMFNPNTPGFEEYWKHPRVEINNLCFLCTVMVNPSIYSFGELGEMAIRTLTHFVTGGTGGAPHTELHVGNVKAILNLVMNLDAAWFNQLRSTLLGEHGGEGDPEWAEGLTQYYSALHIQFLDMICSTLNLHIGDMELMGSIMEVLFNMLIYASNDVLRESLPALYQHPPNFVIEALTGVFESLMSKHSHMGLNWTLEDIASIPDSPQFQQITTYLFKILTSITPILFSKLCVKFISIMGSNTKNKIGSGVVKELIAIYYNKTEDPVVNPTEPPEPTTPEPHLFWLGMKSALFNCYFTPFVVPEGMEEEIRKRQVGEGFGDVGGDVYYRMLRCRQLANLIMSFQGLRKVDGYFTRFIAGCIQDALRSKETIPVLEGVRQFIRHGTFQRGQLYNVSKQLNIITEHIQKVEPNLQPSHLLIIKEFNDHLLQKARGKQVLRDRKGKALPPKKRKGITNKIAEIIREEDEEDEEVKDVRFNSSMNMQGKSAFPKDSDISEEGKENIPDISNIRGKAATRKSKKRGREHLKDIDEEMEEMGGQSKTTRARKIQRNTHNNQETIVLNESTNKEIINISESTA